MKYLCTYLTEYSKLTFNNFFRQYPFKFSTCPHKFKWLLCTENPVLKADYEISIIMRFVLKKTIGTYSKAKSCPKQHKFQALNMCLSSFQIKSDAKTYILTILHTIQSMKFHAVCYLISN